MLDILRFIYNLDRTGQFQIVLLECFDIQDQKSMNKDFSGEVS